MRQIVYYYSALQNNDYPRYTDRIRMVDGKPYTQIIEYNIEDKVPPQNNFSDSHIVAIEIVNSKSFMKKQIKEIDNLITEIRNGNITDLIFLKENL